MPSSRPTIDRTQRSIGSLRPHTSENRGKYYYRSPLTSRADKSSIVATRGFVILTPPTLKSIEEAKAQEQDKNEPVVPQAHPEDRSDDAEDVVTANVEVADEETEIPEEETPDQETTSNTGDNVPAKSTVAADTTIPEEEDKNKDENLPKLPNAASAPPRLVSQYCLPDPAPVITPVNRVMSKLYNFPLIEQKPLRFPTIVTSPSVPPNIPPQTSRIPFMKLEPSQTTSSQAVQKPSVTSIKRSRICHGSPNLPRSLNHGIVPIPQPHEKLSHAEIVRRFTRNLQKELYCSPDMRNVTMKEGKKHEFFGHNAYDFH